MNESVIIDAVRSPIGIKNGNMVGIRPDDLTAQVVKELLKRNKMRIQMKSMILYWVAHFLKAPRVC